MNTPIADFVQNYEKKKLSRLHMPGHKGQSFLGCERYDITEISGADALYEAEGIIAESERNASMLFGSGQTLYSTEGSSQCIRAMLCLAVQEWKSRFDPQGHKRPVIVAARNVHKAFVYAASLLDLDVIWLWPETECSICSCHVAPENLEQTLDSLEIPPAAVYVTSPDYLGNQQDIQVLADICHAHDTLLTVDNAHGAYLHFLKEPCHPLDLGADICCDSAHKTLPVLTGGAYLQISTHAPESFFKNAKHAMALFGSTSPSYLTLSSLDLCNQYLFDGYSEKVQILCEKVAHLENTLHQNGWKTEGTEPTKLTISMPAHISGTDMAEKLRTFHAECEFADPDFVVLMFTPENQALDFERIEQAFGKNPFPYEDRIPLSHSACERKCTIREAMFSPHETISIKKAVGRICGTVTVSCPPAIPIVVSGEIITLEAAALFEYYGIEAVDVLL